MPPALPHRRTHGHFNLSLGTTRDGHCAEHPCVPLWRIADHRSGGHGRIKQHVASTRQPGAWRCARWLGDRGTSHSHHEDRAAPNRENDTLHSIFPSVYLCRHQRWRQSERSTSIASSLVVRFGVCAYVDGVVVASGPISRVIFVTRRCYETLSSARRRSGLRRMTLPTFVATSCSSRSE
jgi:hypothetical protein